MADACVFLMENVDFKDVNPPAPQGGTTVLGCHPQQSAKSVPCEARNTHINIGTGKEISIKNLAELVKEKIGYKGELFFNADKPDGTMRKLTDVSKLHSLGWKHEIEIEEGVEKLYDWYRE